MYRDLLQIGACCHTKPFIIHLFIYLFITLFHISHLGTYHGNGKYHIQYTSSGNLQMV